MLDLNTLTVAQLIELVRQEHRAHQDRTDEIENLEHQIFKINAQIYAINRRGDDYRTNGPKYLNALNAAITDEE